MKRPQDDIWRVRVNGYSSGRTLSFNDDLIRRIVLAINDIELLKDISTEMRLTSDDKNAYKWTMKEFRQWLIEEINRTAANYV